MSGQPLPRIRRSPSGATSTVAATFTPIRSASPSPPPRSSRAWKAPPLSVYRLLAPDRAPLSIELIPRADGVDGLVALASLVSKTLREHWMDVFNHHWLAQIPGLKPTAGYPVDAVRFRQSIEPLCHARGLDPSSWWRTK